MENLEKSRRLEKSKFRIRYGSRRKPSWTVDYPALVSLVEKRRLFGREEVILNNPVGKNRNRKLTGDEVLKLWHDVEKLTKLNQDLK